MDILITFNNFFNFVITFMNTHTFCLWIYLLLYNIFFNYFYIILLCITV